MNLNTARQRFDHIVFHALVDIDYDVVEDIRSEASRIEGALCAIPKQQRCKFIKGLIKDQQRMVKACTQLLASPYIPNHAWPRELEAELNYVCGVLFYA